MSDINFLANKKPADDQESRNQDDKTEKIIWSEPDEDKPLVKEAPFSLLAFLNKKKADKNSVLAPKPAISKDKIKESRRKILKLIKHHEGPGLKQDQKPGKGWLAGFRERFKKPPSHKEVLIDYQRVFNQEKVKRSSAADQLIASKFDLPARLVDAQTKKPVESPLTQKQKFEENSPKFDSRDWGEPIKKISNIRPVVEKKPAAAQSAGFTMTPFVKVATEAKPAQQMKAVKESFLSRFFKMIKAKIAALNRPKLRPAKINLSGIISSVEPEMAKPPLAEPVPAEKRELEIKAQPLEPKAPTEIKTESSGVIETNLIKGEIITFFDWRRKVMVLINAILIPVFSVAAIYLGLMYYQKQSQIKAQEQAKKLSELTVEIKQAEVGLKEITDFQARLRVVSQIFAKHIYWTNLFKFLEDNTIKDVYYIGFDGSTDGNYSLDAIASRFSNIPEQIDILRNNQQVTDVRTVGGEAISSDSADNKGVKFNINLSILKSIFTE